MKEIFYSNGVDVFGPVTMAEFCRNRYYKSTLIWYEGLAGWVNIGDCDDLKHLVGTMSTPALDNGVPHSLPNLTPPLTKTTRVKSGSNKKYVATSIVLFIVLIGMLAYYFNNKVEPAVNIVIPIVQDTIIEVVDTVVIDSNAIREAGIVKKAQAETEMKTYRMNWEKFITAVPNDYKQKEIGGIDDLKVIVMNNSPYKLDNLKVKVSYVKANGDSYQTEIMEFDNVDANSSKELFAPKSDRGVKVSCSIQSVSSRAMNFCIDKKAKNFARKKGEDPYKCQ